MSNTTCPNDVGAPGDWLASAGLESDRKACAVPLGLNCGLNDVAIRSCCTSATQNQKISQGLAVFASGQYVVCALPVDATNATYQSYKDCLLNYPGRDGGFRCNDLNSTNRGPYCNNINGAISPPFRPPLGQQSCVTGAFANTSAVMENCCGSSARSFAGGCWQYCIGPANQTIGRCISDGLRVQNISTATVGCLNGTASSSGAYSLNNINVGSTIGLVAVVAFAIGLL